MRRQHPELSRNASLSHKLQMCCQDKLVCNEMKDALDMDCEGRYTGYGLVEEDALDMDCGVGCSGYGLWRRMHTIVLNGGKW